MYNNKGSMADQSERRTFNPESTKEIMFFLPPSALAWFVLDSPKFKFLTPPTYKKPTGLLSARWDS